MFLNKVNMIEPNFFLSNATFFYQRNFLSYGHSIIMLKINSGIRATRPPSRPWYTVPAPRLWCPHDRPLERSSICATPPVQGVWDRLPAAVAHYRPWSQSPSASLSQINAPQCSEVRFHCRNGRLAATIAYRLNMVQFLTTNFAKQSYWLLV